MRVSVIRVGPAGWSYEDWKGKVYPHPPPRGFDPLKYIAEFFGCVELNNMFYRPPAARMSEGWVRKIGSFPDFRFTAKVWQKFTHDREGFTDRDVEEFKQGIRPLADAGKLAALLAQFPWYVEDGEEARARIAGVAEHFSGLAPVLVEVRHRSFDTPAFLEFLVERGIGFCNIDQPASRSSISGTRHVTGPVGYLRLHGRNREAWFRKGAGRDEKYDYLYSEEELGPQAEAARAMAEKSPSIFVILNNHFQGKAVVNAVVLKRLLGQAAPVPALLQSAYPEAL